ncbi:PorT family protein [Flavobacterium sp. MAH-1]|uniref:PorT family protein n=1 Tax=Flavobacterium agri TaxID=2743471 RepID=A0A7Y8Y0D6_9FLAO|nr:outer membrane beta-barrel protein [Flavobacterium agri]NUY80183.1 PorT family protein [Flavobacterium agri]NYA70208.1 PorT family protein [Flavobacterium agri]
MSERKNIDRLFQERFKDFESEPSEQAWKNIEARLEEKKDRKLIPFWFKYAGVAAVLLIGLLLTLDNGDNNPKVNGGTQVVSAPDKKAKAEDNDVKKPTNIGNEDFGKPDNAITTNDAIAPKANNATKVGNANKANGTSADPMWNPNGSSASGIRQNDTGITSYPSKKASDKKASGRILGGNDKVLPSVEESREQYASATSKNRKAKKGSNAKSNKTDLQYTDENNNANESQIAASNGKSGKNPKTNDNLKNENQIAVNENNQSGQPEQHNEKEVTAKTTTSTQAIAAKTDDIKKDSTGIATVEEPNALEELLKNEKENKSVTENEPKMNRWQVSPRVAPIYLSSTSSGSPIDSRFAKNDKDYKTQLSYGVGVGYSLNKRLSVRAGVNSLSFEYNTNNVVAMQSTVGRQQLEHVKPTLQGAFLRIENKDPNAPVELTSNGLVAKEFSSSLSQKTGYIEVPVELSYKLIDKRFGVDVIGGFSTLFLNENEVSVVSSDNEIQVGKADNLNATSFSTNIGLGLRYNIWKALQFNVEPMFKYQINTYSESGNFKPYFFGLYTGLNYRF